MLERQPCSLTTLIAIVRRPADKKFELGQFCNPTEHLCLKFRFYERRRQHQFSQTSTDPRPTIEIRALEANITPEDGQAGHETKHVLDHMPSRREELDSQIKNTECVQVPWSQLLEDLPLFQLDGAIPQIQLGESSRPFYQHFKILCRNTLTLKDQGFQSFPSVP